MRDRAMGMRDRAVERERKEGGLLANGRDRWDVVMTSKLLESPENKDAFDDL
jgi:hypothetical protein